MDRAAIWRLAACVVAALAGLICAHGLLRSAVIDRDLQRSRNYALQQDLATKQARAVNLPDYAAQLDEARQLLQLFLQRLPSRFDDERIQLDLRQYSLAAGLRMERLSRGVESRKEFYAELPYELKLVGRAADFVPFFEQLTSDAPLQSLRKLSIAGGAGPAEQSIEMTLVHFRYVEEDE